MPENLLTHVKGLAEQVTQREGCELYDVEFSGTGRHRVLRVYVDKPGGVGIEDCTNVSRGLNLLLDVEDVVPGGEYSLEVSSPGLERPLRYSRHFSSVIGEKIWVKTEAVLEKYGVEDRSLCKGKQVKGILESVLEKEICLRIESGLLQIPLEAINQSKLVFDFNKKQERVIVK